MLLVDNETIDVYDRLLSFEEISKMVMTLIYRNDWYREMATTERRMMYDRGFFMPLS